MENSKVTIGIVEDEPQSIQYMKMILEKEFPQIHISFTAESISEAALFLCKNSIDILLLDIQLGNDNVFKLFDKININQLNTQIIFITAYEQYAIPSIKLQPVAYLLKPINPVDFIIAISECLNKRRQFIINIEQTQRNDRENFLIIPNANGFLRIPQKDILFCEADSNYTKIMLVNDQCYYVSKSLKEFEITLNPNIFFRIHHKYLINTNYVSEYIRGKGGKIILNKSNILDVSARKKADLMEFLKINND